jgi:hypothetical protein
VVGHRNDEENPDIRAFGGEAEAVDALLVSLPGRRKNRRSEQRRVIM